MNLFELIFFILCIVCGLVVGNWFWNHFGLLYSPSGFLLGFFAIIGGIKLLQLWLEFWHKVFPLRPICQENVCLSDDYRWQHNKDGAKIFKCECGVLFLSEGKRFMRILPDNSLSPYMKRGFLRVWKRDKIEK
jgi:hypothetical protein